MLPIGILIAAKKDGAAVGVVQSGQDGQAFDALYREPLAALQDDEVALPEKALFVALIAALFAYYAIRNLLTAHALHRPLDRSLVIDQALAAISEEDAVRVLGTAVRDVAAGKH
ncbi:hypothetical protein [Massilia sp. PWRC2]|uniref:hypothetical protein n=1 Tax=Massilia sp. PWRC2 TaxID=2804626 RepID=UPI003CEBCE64